MKKIFKLTLMTVLGFSLYQAQGQQDAQYTQYMYNTISVNPAYAGSRGALSIVGLHRSQWVGVPGAPSTQTFAVNTPLGEENKIGLGVSVINDAIGPTNETYMDVDFSYTIPTSEEGKLSLGLKAGAHLLNVDLEQLERFNANDNIATRNIDNRIKPQLGIGMYFHTNKYYVGLSAPNLLQTDHFDESSISSQSGAVNFLAEERINFYLIGGYVLDVSDNLKFKPAVLGKMVLGAPIQVDISGNFLINKKLTLGLGYRWGASISAIAGFQVTDGIMLGFAYDRDVNGLGDVTFNNGSYEAMLRFELFSKYDRVLSPRFF